MIVQRQPRADFAAAPGQSHPKRGRDAAHCIIVSRIVEAKLARAGTFASVSACSASASPLPQRRPRGITETPSSPTPRSIGIFATPTNSPQLAVAPST